MKEQHSLQQQKTSAFDKIALLKDSIFSMQGIICVDDLAGLVATSNTIISDFENPDKQRLEKFLDNLLPIPHFIDINYNFIETMARGDKSSKRALLHPVRNLLDNIQSIRSLYAQDNKQLNIMLQQIYLYYDSAAKVLENPLSNEWIIYSTPYTRICNNGDYFLEKKDENTEELRHYPDKLARLTAMAKVIMSDFKQPEKETLKIFLDKLQLVANIIQMDQGFVETMLKEDELAKQKLLQPVQELRDEINKICALYAKKNQELESLLHEILHYYENAEKALKNPLSDEWIKHSTPYARICDGEHYYFIEQEVARKLLCINRENMFRKENESGNHAVSHWENMYFKSHQPNKSIDPAKEFLAYVKSHYVTGEDSVVTPTCLVMVSSVLTTEGKQRRLLQASLEVKGPSLGFLIKAHDMVQYCKNKLGLEKLNIEWKKLLTSDHIEKFISSEKIPKENEEDSLALRKESLLKIYYKKAEQRLQEMGELKENKVNDNQRLSNRERRWAYLLILKDITQCLDNSRLPKALSDILNCPQIQGQLNQIGRFVQDKQEDHFFSALALLKIYPELFSKQIAFEDMLLWPSLLDYLQKKLFLKLAPEDMLTEMLGLMSKFDMENFSHHGIDGMVSMPNDGKGDNINTLIQFHPNGKIKNIKMFIIDADGITKGNSLKAREHTDPKTKAAKKQYYAAVKFLPFSMKELMDKEIPVEFWNSIQKPWQRSVIGFLKDCLKYNKHIQSLLAKRIITEERDLSQPAVMCGVSEKNLDPLISFSKQSFLAMKRVMIAINSKYDSINANNKNLESATPNKETTTTMAKLLFKLEPILHDMYNYADSLSGGLIHSAFAAIFHEELTVEEMSRTRKITYVSEHQVAYAQNNNDEQWTPERAIDDIISSLDTDDSFKKLDPDCQSSLFEMLCEVAPENMKKEVDFSQFNDIEKYFKTAVKYQFNNFTKVLLEQVEEKYAEYKKNNKNSTKNSKVDMASRFLEEPGKKKKSPRSGLSASQQIRTKKSASFRSASSVSSKISPRESKPIPSDYSYLKKCCNENYMTPLMIACEQANFDLIKYFHPYLKEEDVNADKETVFHLLLRNFSKNSNMVLKCIEDLTGKASRFYLNIQNKKGETALHVLFQQCANESFNLEDAIKIIELLHKKEANIELTDNNKCSALDLVTHHYFVLLKESKYKHANTIFYQLRIVSSRGDYLSDSFYRKGFLDSLEKYKKLGAQLLLNEEEIGSVKKIYTLVSLFFYLVKNGHARNANSSQAYYFIKSLFSSDNNDDFKIDVGEDNVKRIKQEAALGQRLLKMLASSSQSMRWFLALFALVEESEPNNCFKSTIYSPSLSDRTYSMKKRYQEIILNPKDDNKKDVPSLGKVIVLNVKNELGLADEVYVTEEDIICSQGHFAFSFMRKLVDGLAISEEPFYICNSMLGGIKYFHFYHACPGRSLNNIQEHKDKESLKQMDSFLSNVGDENYTYLYLSLLLLNPSRNTMEQYNLVYNLQSESTQLVAVGRMQALAPRDIIFNNFSRTGLESIIFLIHESIESGNQLYAEPGKTLNSKVIDYFLSIDIGCFIRQLITDYEKTYGHKINVLQDGKNLEKSAYPQAFTAPSEKLIFDGLYLQQQLIKFIKEKKAKKQKKENAVFIGQFELLEYLRPWAHLFYSEILKLTKLTLDEKISSVKEINISKIPPYLDEKHQIINYMSNTSIERRDKLSSMSVDIRNKLLLHRYGLQFGDMETFKANNVSNDPKILLGTHEIDSFDFTLIRNNYSDRMAQARENTILEMLNTLSTEENYFSFCHCAINDNTLENVCRNNSRIEVLRIEYCNQITLKGIQTAIKTLPTLRCLIIKGLEKVKIFELNSNLTYLKVVSGNEIKLNLPNLTHLVLDNLTLLAIDKTFKIINSKLRYLEILHFKSFLKANFQEVFKEVKDIETLEMIKIPKCKEGNSKDSDLYTFLKDWMTIFYPRNIHFFHNSKTPILDRVALDLFSIILDLDPAETKFTQAFIQTIKVLACNKFETQSDYITIRLSAEDFRLQNSTAFFKPTLILLCKALSRTPYKIISLDFSNARLGNSSILKLFSVLENKKEGLLNLRSINLSNNNLGTETINPLLKFLDKCGCLQNFIYANNSFFEKKLSKSSIVSNYPGAKDKNKQSPASPRDYILKLIYMLMSKPYIRHIDITNNDFRLDELDCTEYEYAIRKSSVDNNRKSNDSQKSVLKNLVGQKRTNSKIKVIKNRNVSKGNPQSNNKINLILDCLREIIKNIHGRNEKIDYKLISHGLSQEELALVNEGKTIILSKDKKDKNADWFVHFINNNLMYSKEKITKPEHISLLSEIIRAYPLGVVLTELTSYREPIKKVIKSFDTNAEITFKLHESQQSYSYVESESIVLHKKIKSLNSIFNYSDLIKIVNLVTKTTLLKQTNKDCEKTMITKTEDKQSGAKAANLAMKKASSEQQQTNQVWKKITRPKTEEKQSDTKIIDLMTRSESLNEQKNQDWKKITVTKTKKKRNDAETWKKVTVTKSQCKRNDVKIMNLATKAASLEQQKTNQEMNLARKTSFPERQGTNQDWKKIRAETTKEKRSEFFSQARVSPQISHRSNK